jgi:uncharacterized MnhB-related membrane protein
MPHSLGFLFMEWLIFIWPFMLFFGAVWLFRRKHLIIAIILFVLGLILMVVYFIWLAGQIS